MKGWRKSSGFDATFKRLIREKLRNVHYKIFLENLREIIYVHNTRGILTYVNKYAEKVSHYRVNELVGKHFCKIVAPESLKDAMQAFKVQMRGKNVRPFQLTILDKNGNKLYLHTREAIVRYQGKIFGVLGIATDITKFKKTMEELSKMVKELKLLYKIGGELVSIMDPEALFKKIIHYLRNTFGYERVSILLLDEITNDLIIRAAEKPYAPEIHRMRIRLGQGITGYVAKTGKPYLCNDVSKDHHYFIFDRKTKSEICVPLKISDMATGVINVESYKGNTFDNTDVRLLTLISEVAAIAIENSKLYQSLESSYLETIKALVSAVEAKDLYTKGHSERVRKYALQVARKLNLTASELRELNYAGYLHDIGKIGVSDFLLTKPTSLTAYEYELMKEHPKIGYNMIKHIKHLSDASYIIKTEHEKYNGTGYPNGLKKSGIPLGARIIAVADAYDAMTTYRPYRRALSRKEAIKRLKENAGSQFDPIVVRAFLRTLKHK